MHKRFILTTVMFFLVILSQIAIASPGYGNYGIIAQAPGSPIIAIDPGHGGYDPGAVSGNVLEKDINLIICKKLKEHLENKGFLVVLTRNGDYNHAIKGLHGKEAKRYDLTERIKIINSSNAEILLTVHVNSNNKNAYEGAEAFYHPKSLNGKMLANYIQEELRTVPEIRKRLSKNSKCFMLCNTKIPAVLVEIGYLSNPREQKKLEDPQYLDLIAQKITAGVLKYYDLKTAWEHMVTFLPLNF
ncbi:N-acetylmuramoyl-L-alanine amidase family protein [Dehalobacterium formicoaceticum]|uniref:N-acetylmuramoyl-L-alanine amidase n=1 Tax=Dehalobacterium formicoaceticum TaxID=51515 RepID=A0ABT1Y6X0_9FIRM|nr:N-acetylmuramoyl-L-alanine amidase [Dehalobacterium formicoaceticum]MCR6546637.1 N-acetylmuramoyl-L-alanine amidase [Dehalobacterium formicoaceticum]